MSPGARPRSPLSSWRAVGYAALAASAVGGAFLCVGRAADAADPPSPTPDFAFFTERIEPVVLTVCAQCHAGKGHGQYALIVHAEGAPFPEAERRKNYETILKLLVPGKPEQSKFLLKPLAVKDGGVLHEGGDRIFKGTPTYRAWVDFIDGVKGTAAPAPTSTMPAKMPMPGAGSKDPPATPPAPPEEIPAVTERGLVLEAERLVLSGGARVADSAEKDSGGKKVVAAGPAGGRATAKFRVARTGEYAFALRLSAAETGVRVRVDGGEPLDVAAPKAGIAEALPSIPLDGGKPLDGRSGRLAVAGDSFEMDGRQAVARFLSPADLPHSRLDATISLPEPDDAGRDDAWLLFDCLDPDNGKFFGLSDGGRRVVMGVLEGGRPRVIRAVPTPSGSPGERLTVDLADGVAFGRLDGKALLFVNFDRNLGAARFGFLTHGLATVRSLVATRGAEEVHRLRPSEGGVLRLRSGTHSVEVELMAGGASVAALTVKDTIP